MFSPPARKSTAAARKNAGIQRDDVHISTPLPESRRPLLGSPTIANRPATGTPAPWASRLSVLARVPPAKRSERGDEVDAVQPVYVGEFPQIVRDAQAMAIQNRVPDASVSGGMDKETSLAWIICGNKLFVWNFLSAAVSSKCITLDLPSVRTENRDMVPTANWLFCAVDWGSSKKAGRISVQPYSSTGIVLCNKKTCTLIFWPDICNADMVSPLIFDISGLELAYLNGKSNSIKQRPNDKKFSKSCSFTSLIASAIPASANSCIAIACRSDGVLWKFVCRPSGIECSQIEHSTGAGNGPVKGYPRSLAWHSHRHSSDESPIQFLLLNDHKIECFAVKLGPGFDTSQLWSHEIVGSDGDLGIQKDLAGQKKIWPLDLDVDVDGKVITVLIAIFCMNRVTSSSYTEYSLLTLQYKSGADAAKPDGKVLEKKAAIQVIIPKAGVENEEFLFSMRLKVGGKPDGSAIILSGDGTATVSYYWGNSTKLYKFDLPYDAGKVLDASVLPSLDENGDGAWVVLTEKAGVWAIPEKAVLLGGVEPPERSLSRKGSSNDRSLQEEERNLSISGNIFPKRATSEAWDASNRPRAGFTGVARRSPQDEESEALLSQLFHDFLLSGQVDGVLDKLRKSRAFEREGEVNVFTRTSKSIVDTLAKHWTATRGPEIAFSVVSTQLMEKQQKHQKYLQFLALSKCHEELCSQQRQSLLFIMEHGEKLAGMVQLRQLQSLAGHASATGPGSYHVLEATRTSGALWDLIQFVGERARRNTVLLMDRDKAEVFYSRVSELEELFHCLERQLEYIITGDMPILDQFQRASELSTACVTIYSAAMQYRSEHQLWYPAIEGLTPWYAKSIVWNGLWSLATFMVEFFKETNRIDDSMRFDFYSNLQLLVEILLEAYSSSISAKVERKEEHRTLLDEYWKRRDFLLDALYQQVKKFFEAKLQDSTEENNDQNKDLMMTLSTKLLSIAKRHEGYQTMWSICCDLNDSELLRSLMQESMGPKGGFSCFVFKQLYESKQFSKLVRLGEEFQDELASFLARHPDLLWLHEVFLHQFSSASETLHALSLSKDGNTISPIEEIESSSSRCTLTLAKRKHFLNLAKISTLAAKDAGYELKMKRIEADLNILQLQEEIMRFITDDDEKQIIGQKLLPPIDLIELCLKLQSRELSLRVFDVFSSTSSSFMRSNTSLLEECWRNAANQDDWGRLHQMSTDEGWSDEKTLEVLKDTILFQASNKCYGPDVEIFEGRFDEVLPLRQEDTSEHPKEIGVSVEAVLMQHKDYPDAGKLILTAIMLGSVWGSSNGAAMDADDSYPME